MTTLRYDGRNIQKTLLKRILKKSDETYQRELKITKMTYQRDLQKSQKRPIKETL